MTSKHMHICVSGVLAPVCGKKNTASAICRSEPTLWQARVGCTKCSSIQLVVRTATTTTTDQIMKDQHVYGHRWSDGCSNQYSLHKSTLLNCVTLLNVEQGKPACLQSFSTMNTLQGGVIDSSWATTVLSSSKHTVMVSLFNIWYVPSSFVYTASCHHSLLWSLSLLPCLYPPKVPRSIFSSLARSFRAHISLGVMFSGGVLAWWMSPMMFMWALAASHILISFGSTMQLQC